MERGSLSGSRSAAAACYRLPPATQGRAKVLLGATGQGAMPAQATTDNCLASPRQLRLWQVDHHSRQRVYDCLPPCPPPVAAKESCRFGR